MSSNIQITKICEYCGKEFTARTTKTRFCSDTCAKRAYKQRKKNEKIRQVALPATQRAEYQFKIVRHKEYLSIAETCQLLGLAQPSASQTTATSITSNTSQKIR